MNVRNEIKAQIIRAGMTMRKLLTCSRTSTDGATAFPTCPQNYSGKASDTRKYWSLPMCWDATLYGSKDGRSDAPGNSPSHLPSP